MPQSPDPVPHSAFREAVLTKIRADLEAERVQGEALRVRVLPLLHGAVASVRGAGRCGRVWLFGSFAWGRPGERSDIDLLVEGDDGEVAWEVSRACHREVHAIALQRAPDSLRERVLAEGVLL